MNTLLEDMHELIWAVVLAGQSMSEAGQKTWLHPPLIGEYRRTLALDLINALERIEPALHKAELILELDRINRSELSPIDSQAMIPPAEGQR